MILPFENPSVAAHIHTLQLNRKLKEIQFYESETRVLFFIGVN